MNSIIVSHNTCTGVLISP